jgi:spore maturation protein CgeB
VDIRKLRPGHVLDRRFWVRAAYALRDLTRPALETAMVGRVEIHHFPRLDVDRPTRPLRVMFAAPRFDYGDPRRGFGIEENLFAHALIAMGHQVVRFDPPTLVRAIGRAGMNRMLLEVADRYQPDVLLMVLFKDEFDPAVVSRLTREMHGHTVNWFCDDQWRYDSFSRRWASNFGWVVTTSREAFGRYAAEGISSPILSQWACNHFLYRPLPLAKEIDISFVGQPHGDRVDVIEALRRAGLNVVARGLGWPGGRMTQGEMIRFFSISRINLNLSNASTAGIDQVKARDFEVPGCRGFLVTKRTEEIGRFYKLGQEIETYGDVGELIDTIRRYLADDDARERIAAAGYLRTIRDHTMERRLSAILNHVMTGSRGRPVDLAGPPESGGGVAELPPASEKLAATS